MTLESTGSEKARSQLQEDFCNETGALPSMLSTAILSPNLQFLRLLS